MAQGIAMASIVTVANEWWDGKIETEKRKKSSLKMNSFILISQINQKILKMLIGDVPIDLAEWKQGQAILQRPGITALFSLAYMSLTYSLQDRMSLQ